MISEVAGLRGGVLAGALAVASLVLPTASPHATSAHTARVGGPAPPWSFSISGANGTAYLHAGNGNVEFATPRGSHRHFAPGYYP